MINKIQQTTNNNYRPSFDAKLKFDHGVKKALKEFIDNSKNKTEGVIPFYLKEDGGFDIDKFVKNLKTVFEDETSDDKKSIYVIGKIRKNGDTITSTLKRFVSDNKGVVQDSFPFNPTYLLKKQRFAPKNVDLMDFFNDRQSYLSSTRAKKGLETKRELREKYNKSFWA
jgi:hypothetical protein